MVADASAIDDSDIPSSESDFTSDEDLCLMAKMEDQDDEVTYNPYVPSLSTTVELHSPAGEVNQ